MSNLYNNYFAKDKPLRHYSQHFLVAVIGFLSLPLLGAKTGTSVFWTFIFATYIVDLDGLVSVFVFRKKIKEAGKIVSALTSLKFMESATLGTMHHKKLNRLVVHNIIGLTILILMLIWSMIFKQQVVTVWLWAILFHFCFDIFDDFYQLGHIKNWLWPLKYFSKSSQ